MSTNAGNSRKHILVSGYFGVGAQHIFPAVEGRACVFFSNDESLRGAAESKGWIFDFVAQHPLTPDYRISSQQSKYIKFLQFLKDRPEYQTLDAVTYFDHKLNVKEEHIRWILAHMNPEKSILMRMTPKLKKHLDDEIRPALAQDRYKANMEKTIRWIEALRATKHIKENVRIANTGLIHYARIDTIMPMLDEIYRTVWELGQPECQIVWAVVSQAYEDHIQCVAASDLNPSRAIP